MIKNRGLVVAIAVLLVSLVAPSAWADPVAECKDKVDLISVEGLSNADTATLADLTSTQEAASLALVQKDFTTAKSKLEALKTKVTDLAKGPAAKISAPDAKTLLQDVSVALGCVQSLIDG